MVVWGLSCALRVHSYGGISAAPPKEVRREAMTMAYSDAFTLIGARLALAIVGMNFLPQLPKFGAPGEGH
jgi:hypothetical protein